jgi:hypothetical protein
LKPYEKVCAREDPAVEFLAPESLIEPLSKWYDGWDFGGKFLITSLYFYGTGLLAGVKGVGNIETDDFLELVAAAHQAFSTGYSVPGFVVFAGRPMPIFFLPEDHDLRGTLLEDAQVDADNCVFFEMLPMLTSTMALFRPIQVRELFCGLDLNLSWRECHRVLSKAKEGDTVPADDFAQLAWGLISAAVYLNSIECGNELTKRLASIGETQLKPGSALYSMIEPISSFFVEEFVKAPMLYPSDPDGLDIILLKLKSQLGPFLKGLFFPPPEKNIPREYTEDFLRNLEVCLEFPLQY